MAVDPNHCFEGHDQQYVYLKFYYASKLSKFTPILLVVTPPPLKGQEPLVVRLCVKGNLYEVKSYFVKL